MATASDDAAESSSAQPSPASADGEAAEESQPRPDPRTCKGLAIGQAAFEEAVHEGEFDDSSFLFYLEPAGVLNANLVCTRSYPAERKRAGILMTKAAREARVVFFDDGVNPERYELHFPKEYGYVKPISHYRPETREHAKYPWSKKY